MSKLINLQLLSSNKEEKVPIPLQEDNFGFHKITHIIHKNIEARSKSAPLEENENEDYSDFLNSYNYYTYYNSIVPRDPHLPKPTYVPNQDLCDIKETKDKEEEDQPELLNDVNNKHLETIANMMNNLNIEGNSNMNDINKLINDIPNTNIDFHNQLGNSSNNNGLIQGEPLYTNNLFADFFNNSNIENNNNENNNNENNNNENNINTNNNNENNNQNKVDNINLHNFINNNNNNNNQINMDNNFNSFGNFNIPQKNNNRNINNINYSSKNNEFDMNNNPFNNNKYNNIIYKRSKSEPLFINNCINTKDQLLNMMLLQNLQIINKNEGNYNQINQNFNMNYFNQQINNNNILLNNFNNNANLGININNNIFHNNYNYMNNSNLNNNNFYNSNYPNFFNNKNFNSKNVFNNYNNESFFSQNNQNDYNNILNINTFSNQKPNFKYSDKGNKGLLDFTNGQKRDLTDIKHLEDLVEKVKQLRENNDNNMKKFGLQFETKELIIKKIKMEILNMAKDISGNYAIQKMINNKKPFEVNFILESLNNKMYELTINLYGCRVVQELVSILDNENMLIITSELKPFYKKCIEDKNGNHVIQKLIEKLSGKELNEIYLVSLNNIINLSKHQYGCRVIQRLFKYCSKEQINNMLSELFKDINELIQDQYGNYVIQFILENQSIDNNDLLPIYDSLKGNIYKYSFHKFASNVVERCLIYGNEKQKKDIINEIIELSEDNSDYIINMVKDRFANYVVQKMIENSDNNNQQKIIKFILNKQHKIKNDVFSKHVLNYIEKINSGNIKYNKYKGGNNN